MDGRVNAESTPDRMIELQAQIELLERENERLRRETRRAKQVTHRRAALSLAVIGALCGGTALLLPSVRDLLFSLSGIGLFGAVLTYYLTPEHVLTADVSERVYTAVVENEQAVVSELDLSDERVYLPSTDSGDVRLFIPQHSEYQLPEPEELRSVFVVSASGNQRGVSFVPAGQLLFGEFTETHTLSESSFEGYISQLTDAAVHSFELTTAAEYEVNETEGRLTVECIEPAYNGSVQFDHPLSSFFAVAVATRLGSAVSTTTTFNDETLTTTCQWEPLSEDE
ncbi:hypothetical protein [Haloprofundus sp. MHR1]|uniref:hypothetical protein n=1 Tax=Haloprofundus sp. MHR1 TaxID=2572921 RepID=UPI0010BECBEF|nr:hypothetical protein [Haloprofundus sp. MHR1]QCJ46001.1 hypothetical protein FCF25_02190 [Haloprofundus sp. MHR1]